MLFDLETQRLNICKEYFFTFAKVFMFPHLIDSSEGYLYFNANRFKAATPGRSITFLSFQFNHYNMRRRLSNLALLVVLTVHSVTGYDLILGHLGWSDKHVSYFPAPTLENSASAINIAVDTFFKNGGSKDINIRYVVS